MAKYAPKWAKRRDASESPIVQTLELNGYTVEWDGKVDLLVRHCTWQKNIWVKGEAKTPNRKNGFKPRKDQDEQTQYCIRHCIPIWLDAGEALAYLESVGRQFKLGFLRDSGAR